MPSVIVLTGHPCSGKTTLAERIRQRALEHPSRRVTNVVILNEGTACPDHTIAACYATSLAEKATRGALKSAFDRAVSMATTTSTSKATSSRSSNGDSSASTLIILDSTNYIKGYRYELHCISKAAACSHCVVWCLNSVETVFEWNAARRKEHEDRVLATSADKSVDDVFYSDDLLNALILRYEPPDERNRWDRPLFRIDMSPPSTTSTVAAPSGAGRQALEQSVYNMHNLSEAMNRDDSVTDSGPANAIQNAMATGGASSTDSPAMTPPATQSSTGDGSAAAGAVMPAKKTSSLFKRSSTFKKRDKANDSVGGIGVGITSLTAESLSALAMNQEPTLDGIVPPSSSTANTTTQQTHTIPSTGGYSDHGRKSSSSTANDVTEPRSLDQRIDNFLEEFLFSDRAQLREGTSTRQHVATDSDVLHKVDVVSQQVCAAIVQAGLATTAATSSLAPGPVPSNSATPPWMQGKDEASIRAKCLEFSQATAQELRLVRNQYLQWIATHPPDMKENNQLASGDGEWRVERRIAHSFLEYIGSSTQSITR